jgi:hypothetical protein
MAVHHNAVLLIFSNNSTSVYSLSELLEIIFMKLNIFLAEKTAGCNIAENCWTW